MSTNIRAAIGQAYNLAVAECLSKQLDDLGSLAKAFYKHRQLCAILMAASVDKVATLSKCPSLIDKFNKIYALLSIPKQMEDSDVAAPAKGQAYNLAVNEAIAKGQADNLNLICRLFYKHRLKANIFQCLSVEEVQALQTNEAVIDLMLEVNNDIYAI